MNRNLPIVAALFTAALGVSQAEAAKPAAGAKPQGASVTETPVQTADGVANLPLAHGKTFRTLDDYLAHRESLGAQDAPWYREIRPGVYELWGGRRPPGVTPPTFTREELLKEFGFEE